jgi:hypothetical protein
MYNVFSETPWQGRFYAIIPVKIKIKMSRGMLINHKSKDHLLKPNPKEQYFVP